MEGLSEKERKQVEIFKSRGFRSPVDQNRHDRMKRDEERWIGTISRKMGWSATRIAGILGRNWRTVEKAIERNETLRQTAVTHLVIGPPRNKAVNDGLNVARFASVAVSADGTEAKGCWGWVKVLPSGPSLPLHWRETPFEEEQTEGSRIFIPPKRAAVLDLAFAIPYPQVKQVIQDAEPCQVVPTFIPGATRGSPPWHGEGCWLARPSALQNPDPRLEAYLAPGQYRIEVTVGSERRNGDSHEFTLSSPAVWSELRIFD